ncbi:hypothetical protein ARTHRO9V_210097 [Arthrobacter sp. 9V]|nr:hypothetical protein ARTHRO9V_210097 [Arthrobacter sp. 9V]
MELLWIIPVAFGGTAFHVADYEARRFLPPGLVRQNWGVEGAVDAPCHLPSPADTHWSAT